MKVMRVPRLTAVLTVGLIATIGAASGEAQATPRAVTVKTRPVAAAPALCKAIARVDQLVVRRLDAFPQNHVHFTFPAVVVVDRPSSARDAAKSVCTLPPMPSGTMFCPADFGIAYHFIFKAGPRSFRAVVADVTGCESVRGLGATRWAMFPRFWQRLGKAMGLAVPTYATFRGSVG
jgi:hypothetical protein